MVTSWFKFEEKGQFIGPSLFLLILLSPLPLAQNAHIFLAVFSWVISNWLFTSIPLFITGLMGISLSVILGVSSAKEALVPLADPLIFLFLGGFLLARAFEVIGLDKKLSLSILSHPLVRGSLKRTILAVFGITAFISMWMSNTASTAMMLPIVLGIIKGLEITDKKAKNAILLGTAYSATIGGLGTPMGSPPNIIVIGMLQQLAGIKLNFFIWTLLAVPVALILLMIVYKYTIRQFDEKLEMTLPSLGKKVPFTSKDYVTLVLFASAICLWFTPSLVSLVLGSQHKFSQLLDLRLNPGVVAIFFASMLFVFPLQSRNKILSFQDSMKIDWGSLLLFGSGMSLGQMLFKVGLAEIAGNFVLEVFHGMPFIIFMGAIVCFTIFFTEFVSNTAAANILLPLLIASSMKAGMNPLIMAMAVALSCNLAFMMPVGTPPNAIVYGTGLVTLKEMASRGFILNIISVLLLTVVFYFSQFFL